MFERVKAICKEVDRLRDQFYLNGQITESDIRASTLPKWFVAVGIFLLEREADLRYFYRLPKSGAQYEYYSDIPDDKCEESEKVFARRVEYLREDGLIQADDEYNALCKAILNNGVQEMDRTGTGTKRIFGYQMRFNLENGFPLLTTKKVHTKSIIEELLWFLSGSTNNKDLQARGVSIWDEWANKETGELGPIYSHQWRNFGGDWENGQKNGIDQIKNLIENIKKSPASRRLIVSAWNPKDVPHQALPPCHSFMQFSVIEGKLSCQLYQRSGDTFLGIPFNIASYALLTHMIAQVCDLKVGEFIHTIGDAHIYLDHLDQIQEQIKRKPNQMPRLVLDPTVKDIDAFKAEHVRIENYNPHPTIKGKVSV